ncbi:MAG TPA: hypothetical protein VGB17_11420 [Pyrinomonadaceae bacterium]|jgi:hypothetical protein
MKDYASRNRALLGFVLLPTIFLTVALLGGLRLDGATRAFVFIAPPLITLFLAALLMLLFVRGKLIEPGRWLDQDFPLLTNLSHALTLLAVFFASAQAFNSVLPESGLLHWLFSFFFLWTLWNNQFAAFDARKLLRSLAVLFGTAFVLKHMLLASLYAPEGSWLRRLAGALVEGVSLGTLGTEAFAPATGYISFFTLALYIAGLVLLAPAQEKEAGLETLRLMRAYEKLSPQERLVLSRALQTDEMREDLEALPPAHDETDADADLSEETLISKRRRE